MNLIFKGNYSFWNPSLFIPYIYFLYTNHVLSLVIIFVKYILSIKIVWLVPGYQIEDFQIPVRRSTVFKYWITWVASDWFCLWPFGITTAVYGCLQIIQSICKGFRIRGWHMRYCFLSKAWKEISWFVSCLLETLINCSRQIPFINNHGFSHHGHLGFSRLWQISILCSFESKARKHTIFYI